MPISSPRVKKPFTPHGVHIGNNNSNNQRHGTAYGLHRTIIGHEVQRGDENNRNSNTEDVDNNTRHNNLVLGRDTTLRTTTLRTLKTYKQQHETMSTTRVPDVVHDDEHGDDILRREPSSTPPHTRITTNLTTSKRPLQKDDDDDKDDKVNKKDGHGPKSTMTKQSMSLVSKAAKRKFRSPLVRDTNRSSTVNSSSVNSNVRRYGATTLAGTERDEHGSVAAWATQKSRGLFHAIAREQVRVAVERLRALEKRRRDMAVVVGLFKSDDNNETKSKTTRKEQLATTTEKWRTALWKAAEDVWNDIERKHSELLSAQGFSASELRTLQGGGDDNTSNSEDNVDDDATMTTKIEYAAIDGEDEHGAENTEGGGGVGGGNDGIEEDMFSVASERRRMLRVCAELDRVLRDGFDAFVTGMLPHG